MSSPEENVSYRKRGHAGSQRMSPNLLIPGSPLATFARLSLSCPLSAPGSNRVGRELHSRVASDSLALVDF